MTEAPPSTEELPRAPAQQLPEDALIEVFEPAAQGWMVYYHQAQVQRVIGLPVAMWALVEFEEGGLTRQLIRHFVVTDSGAVVDYLDIPSDFLCVIGPMIKDHPSVILQHLAERGLNIAGGAIQIKTN